MDLGIEADAAELLGPDVPGFLVTVRRIARARLVDGGEDAGGGEFPLLNDQLPGPGDGLLLEVVAEAPVAQHFEKRVVVGIQPHVLQVVVLAAGADALLRVGSPGGPSFVQDARPGVHVRIALTQEDRHELVHPRIREDARAVAAGVADVVAGHDGVFLGLEEIEEGLADLGGGHHERKMGREYGT